MHTNLETVYAPPALVDGADYMFEELFGGETSYENHGNHEDLKKNKKKKKQDYMHAMWYVPDLHIMKTSNVVSTVNCLTLSYLEHLELMFSGKL